jgi:UDP-GlcNAc:undecaprenyl-phosphate GlcNAc-1-phosphate transferase
MNIFISSYLNFIILFLINFLLTLFLSKNIFFKKNLLNENPQNIHSGFISRNGGLSAIISLLFFSFYSPYVFFNIFIQNLILLGFLFIFIIFIEDNFYEINPYFRLLVIFFTSFFFVNYLDNSYFFSFPFLEFLPFDIGSNRLFLIIFYSFALTSLANGFNLIDGANGLLTASVGVILLNLLYVSLQLDDGFISTASFTLLILLSSFFILNYPFGKIFFGDLGAYFFGFLSGLLVMMFYERHQSYSSFGAILLFIYPITEMIFSFFRKLLFEKKSPFNPDSNHFHLKVYSLIQDSNVKGALSKNSLVMPFMAIIWTFPSLVYPLVFSNHSYIIISIFIYLIMYVGTYLAIPKVKE